MNSEKHDLSKVVLFQTENGNTRLEVQLEQETVWLNQEQMTVLFVVELRAAADVFAKAYAVLE